MGGYSFGKIASTIALDAFYDTIHGLPKTPGLKDLRRGIEAANQGVLRASQSLQAGRMGTTLTAAHVIGNRLHLAHVGDCRAYLIREQRAICLTQDHTTVGDLVRMKVISPDRVRTHARRSVLTRSIGLGMFVQPDLSETSLQAGDRLILCCDGVWSVIQDDEFAQVSKQSSSVQALSEDLINLALDRQTDDNVTVVAFHVHAISSSMATELNRRKGWLLSWLGRRTDETDLPQEGGAR